MENKKRWIEPKIYEVNVDNEISALMVSPPGDPFACNSEDIQTQDYVDDPYV